MKGSGGVKPAVTAKEFLRGLSRVLPILAGSTHDPMWNIAFYALIFLICSRRIGTTSNKSPTMP